MVAIGDVGHYYNPLVASEGKSNIHVVYKYICVSFSKAEVVQMKSLLDLVNLAFQRQYPFWNDRNVHFIVREKLIFWYDKENMYPCYFAGNITD